MNEPQPEIPVRPDNKQTATQPGWFKRLFTPAMMLVIVVSTVAAVYGIYLCAKDGEGDVWYATWVFFGALALPTVWSITSTVWRPTEIPPIMDALLRTIVVPLTTIWPGAIAASLAVVVPPINQIIEDARRPNGWHYMFALEDGNPFGITLGLGGLIGVIIAMLIGLFLCVFFVLPWEAWVQPKRAIEGNMLDASTAEALTSNTVAMKMFAILIMLVFAIPTLMFVGKENARASQVSEAFVNIPEFFTHPSLFWGDLLWVAGVVLIPLGVILMFVVRAKQKPRPYSR